MSKYITRVSPRIKDESIIQYYRENYRTLHSGTEMAIIYYSHLRKSAIANLRGLFLNEELKYLIRLFENIELDSLWTQKNMIALVTKNEYKLKQSNIQTGINEEDLIKKLEKLDLHQSWFLSEWMQTYWTLENIDLNDYIKDLL